MMYADDMGIGTDVQKAKTCFMVLAFELFFPVQEDLWLKFPIKY